MGPRTSKIDVAMARLAERQHGVVARRQLLALGLTPRMLRTRLLGARLLELHRGVYAVGHRQLTREGEWLAAVLAGGDGAVLSHRSAAALHGLREERSRRVDVSTAARRLTTNWIELHGRRLLADEDVTVVRRVPVTTVSRTLLDLGELLTPRQLARAINEADVLGLLDTAKVDVVLARAGRHRGAAALRMALDAHHGPTLLRSELERRFRELIADARLPRAEHNVDVAGWEVDAVWPAARLAVELDSRFHDTPAARRRDARKDEALRAAGWTVVRYRWRHVVGDAARTVAALRDAVGSSTSL
jgi:very-short-patch-repair endonuclease/predicted transcriptional regulator of viral defense system